MKILAGTYSIRDSKGIYSFDFLENGGLENPKLFCELNNSKYIQIYDDLVFSIFSKENKSGIAVINKKGEILKEILYEENPSCYLLIIDNLIYTANYHSGEVSCIEYKNETNNIELKLKNKVKIQNKAGTHMIYPLNDKIVVPCLLIDKLFIFDRDLCIMKVIDIKKGRGPRHLAISDNKKYLYLLCELSCEILMLDINDDFKEIKSLNLTKGLIGNPSAAAIRMSEDKKTLYLSVRGKNTITILDVENDNFNILQQYQLTIDHPRDILNIKNDEFLLVSGMNSDKVVSFRLKDRIIEKECSSIQIPEGVSMVVV